MRAMFMIAPIVFSLVLSFINVPEILLQPGSYHIMPIVITHDLKVGDRFLVDLVFENNESLAIESEVREP